jgi:hypothetical protein
MFPVPIATALCARALANGGFTFRIADATYPTEGYAVALPGHEQQLRELTPGAIADYMTQHAAAFDSAGHCLGAWFNAEAGLWYLDISIVVPTYRAAIALGRQHMQIAVYDLALGQSLDVPFDYPEPPLDNAAGVVIEGP